jgi:hypothetical protein
VKPNRHEQPRGVGKGIFEFLYGLGISNETNPAKAERRGNIYIYFEICAEHSVRGPIHCSIGTDCGWPSVWKPSLVYWWVV